MSDTEELARLIQRGATPPLSREVALSVASIILTSDWFRQVRLDAVTDYIRADVVKPA